MMKKTIVLLMFISLMSCKPTGKITIYKDKETITSPYTTNSIADFPWKFKKEKVIDSVVIKRKKEKDIYRIINNLDKIPNSKVGIGTPRYAIIVEYKNRKDTLYCHDFNSESYNNESYLIKNNITLKDSSNQLRDFLLKNYMNFIKKEFYTKPGSNKERYYYLNKN